MTRYAENTNVDAGRSRAEIESTLTRYGCDSFMYGWEGEQATLGFRAHGRFIKFNLTMPPRSDYTLTTQGRARTAATIDKEWEQGKRQRWRAAALWIKATLEAIDSGFVTFEDAFLAHTMMPDGSTFGTVVQPQIDRAYADGTMPSGLLQLTTGGHHG